MRGTKIIIALAIVAIAGIVGLLMIDEVSGETTTVTTYRDWNYGEEEWSQKAEYFTQDENTIKYSIYSEDLKGENVNVKLENEDTTIYDEWVYIWGNGYGNDSIYSGDLDEIGEFDLNVYNDTDDVIAATTVYIIGEIEIDFDKDYDESYQPSDKVKIKICLTDGSGTFLVKILDMDNKEIESWSGKSIGKDKITIIYTIPNDIKDGTYEVKVFGDTPHKEEIERVLQGYPHYNENYTFNVKTIALNIECDFDVCVPGATMKIYYTLSYIKTGQGVENGKYTYNITYWKQRSSKESYIEKEFSESQSHGSFDIVLPSDIVPRYNYNYAVKVTGNDSANKYSSESTFNFQIAPPKVEIEINKRNGDPLKDGYPLYSSGDFMVVTVSTQAGGGYTNPSEYWWGWEYGENDTNKYCVFYEYQEYTDTKDINEYPYKLYKYNLNGEDVWLTNYYLNDEYIYGCAPLPEATVDLEINREIEKNEEYETVSTMSVKGRKTDLAGNLYHIFEFGDITPGIYTVNGTIMGIPGIPDKLTNGFAYFSYQKTKSMLLIMKTDKDVYKPGETVKVDYTLSYLGGENVTEVTFDYKIYINTDCGIKIIQKGRFTSGEFSFTIPESIDRNTIYINLISTNDTADSEGTTISIYVTSLQVIVNTINVEYSPGDTLLFQYEIIGGDSVSCYYKLIGNFGTDKTLVNQPLDSTTGKIKYDVPTDVYANKYTIVIYAIDDNGHYVEREVSVNIKYYRILIEFDKESYEPGDIVTFSYEIIALTDKPLEGPFILVYGIQGIQSGRFESMSPYGNITFNLTVNITEEIYGFSITVYVGSNSEHIEMGIIIEKKIEKSVYEKYRDVAAALGFPLAIIIGLALALFFSGRKGKKKEEMPKEFPQKEQPYQPPVEEQQFQSFAQPPPDQPPIQPPQEQTPVQPPPEQQFQPLAQPPQVEPIPPQISQEPEVQVPPEEPQEPQVQPLTPPVPPPSKEITEEKPPEAPPAGTTKCPKCGIDVPIGPERPANIKCPNCGLEGTIE